MDYYDTELATRVESGGWLTGSYAGVEALAAASDETLSSWVGETQEAE